MNTIYYRLEYMYFGCVKISDLGPGDQCYGFRNNLMIAEIRIRFLILKHGRTGTVRAVDLGHTVREGRY